MIYRDEKQLNLNYSKKQIVVRNRITKTKKMSQRSKLIFLLIAVIIKLASADYCQNNPCGAYTCHSLAEWSAFLCDCPSGIVMNANCSNATLATVCSSNVCLNGGTCSLLSSNQFKCSCPTNYSGQYCEIQTFRGLYFHDF